jgi:hypothetical protein
MNICFWMCILVSQLHLNASGSHQATSSEVPLNPPSPSPGSTHNSTSNEVPPMTANEQDSMAPPRHSESADRSENSDSRVPHTHDTNNTTRTRPIKRKVLLKTPPPPAYHSRPSVWLPGQAPPPQPSASWQTRSGRSRSRSRARGRRTPEPTVADLINLN